MFFFGLSHQFSKVEGEGGLAAATAGDFRLAGEVAFDGLFQGGGFDADAFEDGGCHAALLFQQGEQDVGGFEFGMAEALSGRDGALEGFLCFDGKAIGGHKNGK